MSQAPDVVIRPAEPADAADSFAAAWFGDGSENEEGQPDVRYAWRPK